MLPPWYVLADPPDVDIDLGQWRDLGQHRRRMLEKVPSGASKAISEFLSSSPETAREKLSYEDSFKGHLLLRLTASFSEKVKSWLVEMEGDLFDHFFTHESETHLERKRNVLRDVFGPENVKILLELRNELDAKLGDDLTYALKSRDRGKEFICVHYTQAIEMLSWRSMLEMHKGWLIARLGRFRPTLKRRFEEKLEVEIENAQDFLKPNPEVEKLAHSFAEDLEQHVQLRSRFSFPEFEGKELFSQIEIFPPCMRILKTNIERTGYLTHFERLQLGFYLKRMGMNVDEQLRFWFEKSVDNVGLVYEEFLRKHGYQIRHIYGLEGGRKDYDVPSCRSIARGYFCPYVHLSPENLSQLLREGLPGAKGLNERIIAFILKCVLNRRQKEACSRTFAAIYQRQGPKWVNHPLQWVQEALREATLSEDSFISKNKENL